MKKKSIFLKIVMYYTKQLILPQTAQCIFLLGFWEKMNSFFLP